MQKTKCKKKKNDKKETFNYILKINKMLAEFSLCEKKDIGLFLFFYKTVTSTESYNVILITYDMVTLLWRGFLLLKRIKITEFCQNKLVRVRK